MSTRKLLFTSLSRSPSFNVTINIIVALRNLQTGTLIWVDNSAFLNIGTVESANSTVIFRRSSGKKASALWVPFLINVAPLLETVVFTKKRKGFASDRTTFLPYQGSTPFLRDIYVFMLCLTLQLGTSSRL